MAPVIGYAIVGFVVGLVSLLWLDDIDPPDGSKPAIMFVVGLLWPLSLLTLALMLLWFAVTQVCGGFAALWRHARGRVEAREQQPAPPDDVSTAMNARKYIDGIGWQLGLDVDRLSYVEALASIHREVLRRKAMEDAGN